MLCLCGRLFGFQRISGSPSEDDRYAALVQKNPNGNGNYCQHSGNSDEFPYFRADRKGTRAAGCHIEESSAEDGCNESAW